MLDIELMVWYDRNISGDLTKYIATKVKLESRLDGGGFMSKIECPYCGLE